MSAIEKYQPLDMIHSIDDLARLSMSISKSGFYKDITGPEQVGVKLMIARELGLGITAISFIFPVKGKITLGYQILIALVKRSGKYNLKFLERTAERCEIEWFEDGDSVGKSSFTMEDAKRAGLTRNDTYAKNPVEMLVARAVSSGFNSYAPECAGGGLYTIGELDDPTPAPEVRKTPEAPPAPEPSLPRETVIEAEVVDAAPETPISEPPNPDHGGDDAAAASTTAPVDALAAVLKALTPDERKVVKGRTTLLGIKWDASTPARLVEHFAGDDEGLFAHIQGEPNAQVDAEVAGAERFQEHLDAEREAAADAAIANVQSRHEQLAAAGQYGGES